MKHVMQNKSIFDMNNLYNSTSLVQMGSVV